MDAHIITNTVQHSRDWLDWVTAGAAVGGLLVVGAYTALTYKQWQQAKKQSELSREALIYTKRAWLIPHFVLLDAPPNRGAWRLRVAITNTGESPGIVIVSGADLLALNPIFNPPDIPVPPTKIEDPSAIVAQGSNEPYFFTVPDLSAEGENFRNETKVLFATCYIAYTDVFKQRWHTKIAWYHTKDGWCETPGYSEMV